MPRRVTAVEHAHVLVPEILEEPERACRPHARVGLVNDDRSVGRDTTTTQQMLDDPDKRTRRRRVGVDQADPEEVEMHSAREMTCGECFGRTQIQQQDSTVGSQLRLRSVLWTDEQFGVRVALIGRAIHRCLESPHRHPAA